MEQINFWCAAENLSPLLHFTTTSKKHKPFTLYVCFLGIRLSEDTNLFAIVSTISRKLPNLYQENQYVDKRNITTKICRAVHNKQDSHFNTTALLSHSSLQRWIQRKPQHLQSSPGTAVNAQGTHKATSGLCYSYFISMSILLSVLKKADYILLLYIKKLCFFAEKSCCSFITLHRKCWHW